MSGEWKKIPKDSLITLNSYMNEYYIPTIYPIGVDVITLADDEIYSYTPLSEFGFLLIANKESMNYFGVVYFNTTECAPVVGGDNLYTVSEFPTESENLGIYVKHDVDCIKVWNHTGMDQTMTLSSTLIKPSNQ